MCILKKIKMDSFEVNKIIAAVLVTVLIVFGVGKISNIIFHVEAPKINSTVTKTAAIILFTSNESILIFFKMHI